MKVQEAISELKACRSRLMQMGGNKQIQKQHDRGKLTVRERIDSFFDFGTFNEMDIFVKHRCGLFEMDKKEIPADAAVTGAGKVNKRTVYAAADDFTTAAGTFGEMHGKKFCKAIDLAYNCGVPFVQIIDSGGARLQEGQDSSEAYAQLFRRHTIYSGVIPQITLLLGSCGGGAAYGPALTDFIIMVKGVSRMYMGGPAFVKTMLGYEATEEDLGGTDVHSKVTGLCDLVAASDKEAIEMARRLLEFLPSNNRESPPLVNAGSQSEQKLTGIEELLPENSKVPFDMYKVIYRLVDDGDFLEIKHSFARNMITGYGRLGGQTVGIVANQSKHMGGVIDVHASNKAARFVRICDSFNIPLIQLQDSPAVMIGRVEELRGIICHGSKMLHAYTEATVPKITVILRNSYAGAQLCMCNKPIGADIVLAWPTAEIALVGPETAASILFAKKIVAAQDPEEERRKTIEEYARVYVNPYIAAERGYIDDIIEPEETKIKLIWALDMLRNKTEERPWKKHGNIRL